MHVDIPMWLVVVLSIICGYLLIYFITTGK